MKVVILAGGLGSRLADETKGVIPKPMITIGGVPILDHVIKLYVDQGLKDFVIATGHLHSVIDEHIFNNAVKYREWGIARLWATDTGEHTAIGGRIKRLFENGDLEEGTFMMTYGDGLSDVNLKAVLALHEKLKAERDVVATLTAVNPPNRFGKVAIRNGVCTAFSEKGYDRKNAINGGFYVIEPSVVDYIPGDTCVFERDVLPVLASNGMLGGFIHPGEFQMLDTRRDRSAMEKLWESNDPFWLRWGSGKSSLVA